MSKATRRDGSPDDKTRRQATQIYNDRMLAAHANIWLAEGMRRQARTYEAQRQADLLVTREAERRKAEAAQQAGGIPPDAGTPAAANVGDPAKLAERIAYGVDADGRKVTDADREAFTRMYPG